MAWILLVVTGMFEVAMALSLESSDGFRKLGWVLAFLITGGLSFYLLALAMRDLPATPRKTEHAASSITVRTSGGCDIALLRRAGSGAGFRELG